MMTRLAPVVVNEAGDVLVRPGVGVECGLRCVPVFSSLIMVRTMTLTVSPWLFLPAPEWMGDLRESTEPR